MGAGDAQHPFSLQDMLGQPLRPGNVGQALVEYRFKQRIAARNGVADDENVRCQRQLADVETFDEIDAGGAQLVAHRWIDIGIAAGDLVAGGHRQLGDAAHEGAADSQNMNVHVT